MPHGIIMAGEQPLARYCQVASIQTLWSRFRRFGRSHLPQADLLVFDECHRSLAPTYEKLVEQYPDALLIGLTATPARGDGRGLGDVYEDMVQCPPIPVLQEQEFLVGTRYSAPTIPDLEGLTVRAGDYVESELEERMDKPVLVGDIVEHWGRLGSDRKTVVFATSVKHSIHLCNQFREAGVRCEHIDGSTPTGERDTILADLSRGEVQVVTNCMVLTEGWDQPDVSCAVLARPTKSLVLYLQMVGRILRAYPGKKGALIIDHAGTIHQHGFVEEFTDWTLEPDTVQQNPIQAKRQEHDAKPITCTNCFATYVGRPVCPECGHANVRKGRGVGYIDRQLGEVSKAARKVREQPYTSIDKRRWWRMLRGYAVTKEYRMGWAWHQYKGKFGETPTADMDDTPLQPDPEVSRWIKSRQIRYAKSRRRHAA